jgi:uncharacterized membrane protein YGL010W
MVALLGHRGLVLNAVHLAFVCSILRSMVHETELGSALAFYAAYHQDPINQAIHFVFVPTLLYSFMVYFAHFPALGFSIALPGGTAEEPHLLTYATLIPCVYAAYYCYLDPFSGWSQLYGMIVFMMYASAVRLVLADRRAASKKSDGSVSWVGTGWPLKLAAALQVLGWYTQIHPGHAVFEGVKPALLDSLGQSFSVAPLFAFYEGLWALGLQADLHNATAVLVAEQRKAMCAGGGAFRFCS